MAVEEALAEAHARSHPASLAYAACHASFAHQLRRDVEAVEACAGLAVRVTRERRLPYWRAIAEAYLGWAMAMRGRADEGVAGMGDAIARLRSMGAAVWLPGHLSMLAEGHAARGELEIAHDVVREALAYVTSSGERVNEAELHRQLGDLALEASGKEAAAEPSYRRALEVAREQEALLFELRAAVALARLWAGQGRAQ